MKYGTHIPLRRKLNYNLKDSTIVKICISYASDFGFVIYCLKTKNMIDVCHEIHTLKNRLGKKPGTLSVTSKTFATIIVLINDNLSSSIHKMTGIYPIMRLQRVLSAFFIINNYFNDLDFAGSKCAVCEECSYT